jgi:hypothetical protein
LKSAVSNNARLNMTTSPQMRELAHRLLAYEAGAAKTCAPMQPPTHRVYEKRRQSLVEFAGVASFHSLASRALALARTEAPSLSAVRVSTDGALQGLCEIEHQFDIDKVQADEFPAGEGGIILLARLLDLFLIFLGEALTLRLLRNAWPDEAFDDRNSTPGRKA